MKDIIKLGSILLLVTSIAAAGLAAVYSVTKPKIEAQKEKELEQALTTALPGFEKENIEPVYDNSEKPSYFRAYKSQEKKQVAAYAYIAKGAGYSSIIETLVGVDTSGKILGLKVLSQTETPGLGTKIQQVKYGETKPWFQKQFIARQAEKVAVEKDGGQIQSITGATISSRAVSNSIVEGYKKLEKKSNI
jgi:electron transport complex protein RnfG